MAGSNGTRLARAITPDGLDAALCSAGCADFILFSFARRPDAMVPHLPFRHCFAPSAAVSASSGWRSASTGVIEGFAPATSAPSSASVITQQYTSVSPEA